MYDLYRSAFRSPMAVVAPGVGELNLGPLSCQKAPERATAANTGLSVDRQGH